MQIYNIVFEVELDNYQQETLAALDQLLVEHMAEIRALATVVANAPASVQITRSRPYTSALELDIPEVTTR